MNEHFIEVLSRNTKSCLSQLSPDSPAEVIHYYNSVSALCEYAKMLTHTLRKAKNPMNESLGEELAEMTELAKEQRQLLDQAKKEVASMGRVIIANQLEKEQLLSWNAAALVVIGRYCTLSKSQAQHEVMKVAEEMACDE